MTSSRHPPDRPLVEGDGGFAMVTAVILSALIVAITGALVLSLSSGGRESARQRELYEARAAGVSALEYLYAELGDDADFFDDMLATSSPDTYDWIDLSSASAPDTGTDSDWNEFSTGVTISQCSTRLDPCWELRFAGDGAATPQSVAVEAIVRFDCRGSGYCSVRRFQQQLRRTNQSGHSWQRSDLTEVTAGAAIPAVVLRPGQVLNVQAGSITDVGAAVTWDVPSDLGTATGYHIQWKSGTEEYPTDTSSPRHQATTGASYALSGLTARTDHKVRVRAVNGSGPGQWSDDFDLLTSGPPDPPRNFQITSSGTIEIQFSWEAPASGPDPILYVLQFKSGAQDYDNSNNYMNVRSLRYRSNLRAATLGTRTISSGTTYTFRVLAQTSYGVASSSEVEGALADV